MAHPLILRYSYTDTLEANLGTELENSRLVKLLSKLNFINERPEFEKDPRWQESGDRYMIQLFRDYIFHQVNEMGVPVVDMGHVVSCINKVSFFFFFGCVKDKSITHIMIAGCWCG